MADARPAPDTPLEIPADPYPLYAQLLRDGRPFHQSVLDSWVVCRYADVRSVLGDRRFSCDPKTRPARASRLGDRSPIIDQIRSVMASRGRGMVSHDAPEHTRLRGLVNHAFTARRIQALRPRIETLTQTLLDEAPEDFDLIRDFAGPLPALVICELMGLPARDQRTIKRWSSAVAPFVGDGFMKEEDAPGALAAARDMTDYMAAAIEDKRRAPGDDLIGAMIRAQREHGSATDDEIHTQSITLLFAGHETTTNLIGNGTVLLLAHPEGLERLRGDPSGWPAAIEELLRFDPPVQALSRGALEDVTVGEVAIPKGATTTLLIAAANRDPAIYPDPGRLDLTRSPNPHLSFGHGPHMCLGSALARLEARVALRGLFERFPRLARSREPVRGAAFTFRGYASIPLERGPVRSAPASGT